MNSLTILQAVQLDPASFLKSVSSEYEGPWHEFFVNVKPSGGAVATTSAESSAVALSPFNPTLTPIAIATLPPSPSQTSNWFTQVSFI